MPNIYTTCALAGNIFAILLYSSVNANIQMDVASQISVTGSLLTGKKILN